MRTTTSLLSIVCVLVTLSMASAQEPPRYGEPISLDDAKKLMAAAEEEANNEGWPVAIAIVDPGGFMVMFQRLENTQYGSVEVAIEKARTAALYRRPTKVFQDALEEGGANLRLLKLPGSPLEGGVPIIKDGKVIGAVGVSGVQSSQDAQVAEAGIQALSGDDE